MVALCVRWEQQYALDIAGHNDARLNEELVAQIGETASV